MDKDNGLLAYEWLILIGAVCAFVASFIDAMMV